MLVILDLKGFQDTNEQRLRAVKADSGCMTARTTCDVWQRLNRATQRFEQAIQASDSGKRFRQAIQASDSRLGFMPAIRDSNSRLGLDANGCK